MLAADKPPAIQIGNHCFTPYDCPYYGACTAGMEFPDHPISDLYRLNGARREQLEMQAIESILDIPDDFDLTPMQDRIRQAVLSGRPWQSPGLGKALQEPDWPCTTLISRHGSPHCPRIQECGTFPSHSVPVLGRTWKMLKVDWTHSEYLNDQAHRSSTPPGRGAAGSTWDHRQHRGVLRLRASDDQHPGRSTARSARRTDGAE